jgi:hypothetical protein
LKSEISNLKFLEFQMYSPPRVSNTMTARQRRPAAFSAILVALLFSLVSVIAAQFPTQSDQSSEVFKARLSPVPINVSMLSTVSGTGSLTATLKGRRLGVQGSFEGLRSPATTLQIHRGPKGIPGPAIAGLQLVVSNAQKGTVSGTLDLTPDQIADLRAGRWYVQIQSVGAPDGNLWGWLLK